MQQGYSFQVFLPTRNFFSFNGSGAWGEEKAALSHVSLLYLLSQRQGSAVPSELHFQVQCLSCVEADCVGGARAESFCSLLHVHPGARKPPRSNAKRSTRGGCSAWSPESFPRRWWAAVPLSPGAPTPSAAGVWRGLCRRLGDLRGPREARPCRARRCCRLAAPGAFPALPEPLRHHRLQREAAEPFAEGAASPGGVKAAVLIFILVPLGQDAADACPLRPAAAVSSASPRPGGVRQAEVEVAGLSL